MHGKYAKANHYDARYFDRHKRLFGKLLITITISLAAIVMLLCAAWYGMNRELCGRGLPQSEYAAMKLDCRGYGYDRQ